MSAEEKIFLIILRLMGIRRMHWPPTLYQWFKLKDFEANPDIIDAAYQLLIRELQEVVSPNHPEYSDSEKNIARQLQSRSTKKRRQLLDPEFKKMYDESLKDEMYLRSLAQSIRTPIKPPQPANLLSPTTQTRKPAIAPAEPKQPWKITPSRPSEETAPVIKVINTKKVTSGPLSIRHKQAKKRRERLLLRIVLLLAGIASGATLAYLLFFR